MNRRKRPEAKKILHDNSNFKYHSQSNNSHNQNIQMMNTSPLQNSPLPYLYKSLHKQWQEKYLNPQHPELQKNLTFLIDERFQIKNQMKTVYLMNFHHLDNSSSFLFSNLTRLKTTGVDKSPSSGQSFSIKSPRQQMILKHSFLFPIKKENASPESKPNPERHITFKDDVAQKAEKSILSLAPKLSNKIDLKYSVSSRPGQYSNRLRKTNQDSTIIQKAFMGKPDNYLFGVCDGHGEFGHLVSEFVCRHVPIVLAAALKEGINIQQSLIQTFKMVNKQLRQSQSGIDVSLSGTTATFILIMDGQIYCAGSGDSRSIAIFEQKNRAWFQEISVDHKPEIEQEKQRILSYRGRIFQQTNQHGQGYGPQRVWARHADIPGLAMTRSLGDYVAKECGVIPDPDVIQVQIDQNLSFLVLASDGIWEMLSNQQVLNIVQPYVQLDRLQIGNEKLIEKALEKWLDEEGVVDDISVILITFIQ